MVAIILNLKLWIHKNFVCQLQGHENWAYFYVMEAKNGHFSVFSTSWKIDWSKFFSTRKILWYLSTTFSSKSEKLLLNKILLRFRLESEIFHNFINKKLVVWIFVTNRLKGIKKFIIASAKIFGLDSKLAANILRGFDITFFNLSILNKLY